MSRNQKRAIRVNPASVDEKLTEALARELEEGPESGSRSATGWNDPYRASGAKHTTTLGEPMNDQDS